MTVEAVDPAADLSDEHAAVQERRCAVRRGERPRWVVGAAGAAELAHDAVGRAEAQDAAVLDVGDGDRAVWPDVRVVGIGQLARRGAGDAGVAIAPDDPVRADVDLRDLVVELLVRDDPPVAGREERVVGVVEGLTAAKVAGPRELPDDPLRGRDDQELVRVAVGDQYVARHRAGPDRRQAERSSRGRAAPDAPAQRGGPEHAVVRVEARSRDHATRGTAARSLAVVEVGGPRAGQAGTSPPRARRRRRATRRPLLHAGRRRSSSPGRSKAWQPAQVDEDMDPERDRPRRRSSPCADRRSSRGGRTAIIATRSRARRSWRRQAPARRGNA